MIKKVGIVGDRKGMLILISENGRHRDGHKLFLAKCDCGAFKNVQKKTWVGYGESISCGCEGGSGFKNLPKSEVKTCRACLKEKHESYFHKGGTRKCRKCYSARGDELKGCVGCGLGRVVSLYSSDPSSVDGLSSSCLICENPDKILCGKCKEFKNPNNFKKDGSKTRGFSSFCLDCSKKNQKKWYKDNSERVRNNQLKDKYKITLEEYENILLSQGGTCAICPNQPVEGEKAFAVDHDHTCCPGRNTCGKCIRGILCEGCNRGLGIIGEHNLAAAAEYVKRRSHPL